MRCRSRWKYPTLGWTLWATAPAWSWVRFIPILVLAGGPECKVRRGNRLTFRLKRRLGHGYPRFQSPSGGASHMRLARVSAGVGLLAVVTLLAAQEKDRKAPEPTK